MSETVKDQTYRAAGEALLIGFTATDQYHDKKAATYWFNGDQTKVTRPVDRKRNPFVVLGIGIVAGPMGTHYAMARHVDDIKVAAERKGRARVLLYQGEDQLFWFCLCKPGAALGRLTIESEE